MNIRLLRKGVATAMLHLSQETLVEREDARKAVESLLVGLKEAGAPAASLTALRSWARKATSVKEWG